MIFRSHPYDSITTKEAIKVQLELRRKTVFPPLGKETRIVTGVDVSIKGGVAKAALVSLTCPQLLIVDTATACRRVSFPYVPGLLAFREIPAILDAVERMKVTTDLLMVDGQGLAHPRRFGLACHLGVILGLPTIGCAKSRLIGEYREPGEEKGSRTPLTDKGETIGTVFRSRTSVKPLFISSGHMIDLESAVNQVLGCLTRYRLPEPTREAHKASKLKMD